MRGKTAIWAVIILSCFFCGSAEAQKGAATKPESEVLEADALIEAFFSLRTGDLPEMLAVHKIRVLVLPSLSTYFLDKKGQPRGLDYELLKRYEKTAGIESAKKGRLL